MVILWILIKQLHILNSVFIGTLPTNSDEPLKVNTRTKKLEWATQALAASETPNTKKALKNVVSLLNSERTKNVGELATRIYQDIAKSVGKEQDKQHALANQLESLINQMPSQKTKPQKVEKMSVSKGKAKKAPPPKKLQIGKATRINLQRTLRQKKLTDALIITYVERQNSLKQQQGNQYESNELPQQIPEIDSDLIINSVKTMREVLKQAPTWNQELKGTSTVRKRQQARRAKDVRVEITRIIPTLTFSERGLAKDTKVKTVKTVHTFTVIGSPTRKKPAYIIKDMLWGVGSGTYKIATVGINYLSAKKVAVLKPKNLEDWEEIRKEAALYEDLKGGPNITPMFGALTSGEDKSAYKMFLALLEGDVSKLVNKTLKEDRFTKNPKLLRYQQAILVVDMLKAIEFVHRKGYVLDDLKPENFLFQTEKDGMYHAYLADLGLIKKASITDDCLGTYTYIPPERITKDSVTEKKEILNNPEFQEKRKKGDIWCLGLIVHQLLTGNHNNHPYFPEENVLAHTNRFAICYSVATLKNEVVEPWEKF